ncbi:transposase [Nonomuraea lactucae]|uniref:transposase n=1 Tax=Nonomuraea lactucae TaxID=2249762 RepID=UPI0013B40C89|nr:transposase [Nonomuraea lactucae]
MVCPKGTPAMLVRDRLGEIFEDDEFADWYPVDGRPSLSAAQLALVSVLQFTEDYSDRQAACAVAVRIDWKYALGLELEDAGFDYSVLCEFRARLAEQPERADRLLGMMLDRLHAAGLVKGRGRQRTDATHVLAAVRQVSRLELAGESLRAALEELAEAASVWLAPLIEPEWARQYGRRVEIGRVPGGKQAIIARAEQIGRDGLKILQAVWADDARPGCAACRRWRSCARCGCTITTPTSTARCAGGRAARYHRPRCVLTLPTMSMRTGASNVAPNGAVTGFI